MDEYGYDENGEWLHQRQREIHEADPEEFVALKIIAVEVESQAKIREILVGEPPTLKGTVEE